MNETKVSYRPEGFNTVTPYMIVEGADKLIDFMVKAFDAEVIFSMKNPDGKIGHTQVKIGNSMIELSEQTEQFSAMKCAIHLYVEDADKFYKQAMEAGATSLREPSDMPYGDREGDVIDPCGNHWYIATHLNSSVTPPMPDEPESIH